MAKTVIHSEAVKIAAREYLALKERAIHPKGSFDKAGRWYPAEPCACAVRAPSRAFPFSFLVHCRTAAHVAETHGVDRKALLAAAKELP